jgi:hypothetical protein
MSAEPPKKTVLFSGIGLLIAGILLRKLSDFQNLGLLVILLGVGLKTYYILRAIRSGLYEPGKELWLLFAGLTFFLGGLYLRGESLVLNPTYFIVFGLALKILFIIRFIQIVRINRQKVDKT